MTEAECRKLFDDIARLFPPPAQFMPIGPNAWGVYRQVMKEAVQLDLRRRKPAHTPFADWRMALRRKLNGDTR